MEVKELGLEHTKQFIKEWLIAIKNNPLLIEPIKKFMLSEFKDYLKERLGKSLDIDKMEDLDDLIHIIDKIQELDQLEEIISGLIYSLASSEMKISNGIGPITKGIILTSFKELNKKIWKDAKVEDMTLKGILNFYLKYLINSGIINEGDIQIMEVTESKAKIKITNDPFLPVIKQVLDKLGEIDISNICLRGLSFVAFIRLITNRVIDMNVESYSEDQCIINLEFID